MQFSEKIKIIYLAKGEVEMNSYNDYNNVNIDTNKLLSIGFSQYEIAEFQKLFANGAKFTPQALQSYGYNYEQAKRIKYMFDICAGKVQVNTQDELVKHLKKMSNGSYKLSMQDLAISKITNVPRVAVVANIKQSPYDIWNSKNYKGKDALYKVVDVTGQNITVETPRKPQLQYKQAKEIPGMLEIKGVRANGNAVVAFNKNYCTLCNRFVIVGSLKNPEFHLGKYEMICFEGTRVYIFAINMGTRETIHYNSGNQRIYDFGIFPGDITNKLKAVAQSMYTQLRCVAGRYCVPNSTYRVVDYTPKEQVEETEVTL